MNATAQRTHRTVTQDHEQRLETLETLVERLSQNCDYLKKYSDEQGIGFDALSDGLERLKVAIDERDARISTIMLLIRGIEQQDANRWSVSFLVRLRWLLLGR